MDAPLLVDEEQRLAALYRLDALDRPLTHELQGVVRLATYVTGATSGVVNLIDRDRQWQACAIGAEAGEAKRGESMCQHVVAEGHLIHTEDSRTDARFFDNPFVDGHFASVRMYASAPLRDREGHIVGTLCVFDERPYSLDDAQLDALQDLADQLMIILELRHHSSLLAHKNAELDAFAGAIAHDIRNPLGAISGYAEILEDVVGENEKAKDLLQRLQRSVFRLDDLITDVLQYSRSSQGALFLTPVSLGEAAQIAIENLDKLISDSDAKVRFGKLPTINADATQVIQLFQNLMANAIVHRDLTKQPIIEIGATAVRDGYVITVDDNGPGIPADRRERIFDAFERAGAKSSGTGLGLATCERIVERHSGRIWVQDSPLGGARFCVQLHADTTA